MSLTVQQKNIVNPNAKTLNTASRSGSGYDYDSARSKWVIEGIHDAYINFGDFPKTGTELLDVDFGQENSISSTDLLAYAALYPQNAIYNPSTNELDMVSEKDGIEELKRVIESFLNNDIEALTNYLSVTTPESLLPKNQDFVDTPITKALQEDRAQFIQQTISQLVALPHKENDQRTLDIRASFGNPSYSILEESFGLIGDENVVPVFSEQDNIDIYDWRRNVQEAGSTEALYYNPNDFRFYYVKKSTSRNPSHYDVSSQVYEQNKNSARRRGIKEILRFAQKYTNQNVDELLSKVDLQDKQIVSFESYLDPRPSSVWVYAVYIEKSYVDALEYTVSPNKGVVHLSTQEKSTRLASNTTNTQSRRAVYQVKDLQDTLKNTAHVLRSYRSIMVSEGVDFSRISNIRLLDHADRLENFYDSLSSFLEYNDVIMDPSKDVAEFVFSSDMEMLYVVYNGYVYADGLGSTLFSPRGAGSKTFLSANFFSGFPPATLSYVFNGNKSSQKFYGKPSSGWDPWSKFLQEYSYPVFETFPSKLSKPSPRSGDSLPILRADRESLFVTLDKALAESRYVDPTTDRITTKEFFNEVNSAMGSCGTPQSKLLKDSIQLYTLLNGKKDVRKIIRFTISQIRDRVIEDEINKQRVTQAQNLGEIAYDNPSQIYREIERRLNAELACVVGVLGDRLEDQILSPLGVPPNTSNMIREAAVAPLGIDFWSTRPKNTSPWALWRKIIKKIFRSYLKKLLLGVLRDVLEAALGCGPYGDRPGLKDPDASRSYGLANLNAVVDYAEIDILPIAINLGMINKSAAYNQDPNDPDKKIRTILFQEPNIMQLRQFNEDVSSIVTPDELVGLLEGTAAFNVINAINQMVNEGPINERLLRDTITDPDARLDPINITRFQESFKEDDTRYASLGIDAAIIEEYFREIGNQLGPDMTLLVERGRHDIKPIDAYCLRNEPLPPSVMNPGVSYPSPEQVAKQYTTAIEAKKNQIESLCGLIADDLPNIQLKVDNFLDNLPTSEFYNQLLDLIAWLSNFIADWTTKKIYGDESDVGGEDSRPSNFSDTPFGKSLLQSIPEVYIYSQPATREGNVRVRGSASPQGVPADKFYVTPTKNANGLREQMQSRNFLANEKTHQVYGTFYNNTAKIFVNDAQGEFYEASSITLAETNTIGRVSNYSLRGLRDSQGNIANQQLPRFPSDAVKTFLTSPAIGPGTAGRGLLALNPVRKVIANQSEPCYEAIRSFYFTTTARTRLKPYLESLGNYTLVPNIDDCITEQDLAIANASLEGITSRLIPFFINVGPLIRIYLGWNTPDIVSFLTDYIFQKFKRQTKTKGIFGLYLDSMDIVEKVYGLPVADEPSWRYSPSLDREKFYIDQTLNSEEKLKKVIETLIFANFKSIADRSQYGDVNQNVYDLDSSQNWVANSIIYWLTPGYSRPRSPANLADVATAEQQQYIEGLTGNDRVGAFMAYLPLPLLVSMDIIFFDSCINIVENYHRWGFDTRQRIESSDDNLLSAVNPNYVFTPQGGFDVFPVTLIDPLTNEQTTFYSKTGLKNELRRLEQLARETEEGSSNYFSWFQNDYIPTQHAIRTSVLLILEKLNEVYDLYLADNFQNGRIAGKILDNTIAALFDPDSTRRDTLDALTTFVRTRISNPTPGDNEEFFEMYGGNAGANLASVFNSDSNFTLDSGDFRNTGRMGLFHPNHFFNTQVYTGKITFGSPADNAIFPQNLYAPSGKDNVAEAFETWERAVKISRVPPFHMTRREIATAEALQTNINSVLAEIYPVIDEVSDSYDRIQSQIYQAYKSALGSSQLSEDELARINQLDSRIEWGEAFEGALNEGPEETDSYTHWINKSPSDIYTQFINLPGKITTNMDIITSILSDL